MQTSIPRWTGMHENVGISIWDVLVSHDENKRDEEAWKKTTYHAFSSFKCGKDRHTTPVFLPVPQQTEVSLQREPDIAFPDKLGA